MDKEEVIEALEEMIECGDTYVINIRACKEAIKLIKGISGVTRHNIIMSKLDEIKDMFDDPVTNEELIEILIDEEGI